MLHVNKKPQARNGNLVQTKNRPRMNYEWIGKTISEKNPIQKVEKTVNIKVKSAQVNKKLIVRKRTVVQIPFSHSNLKLECKIFTPQNHSLFCSTSCCGVNKITTPI